MTLLSMPMLVIVTAIYLAYRYVVPARFRPIFLTVVSAAFVLTQSAPNIFITAFYVLVTFAALAAGYIYGRKLAGKPADETKDVLKTGVILVILPLVLFKFIGLVSTPLIKAVSTYLPDTNLQYLAPLGISYLTFRILSYMIEVRRGAIAPASFREFLLYVTFWPTLLSGPIERPKPFFAQVKELPQATREDLAVGLTRVAVGTVKTLLLGDLFGKLAQPIIDITTPNGMTNFFIMSAAGLWGCLIAYYFHLYLNFSGYSDIAIGISRMFGYRIRENFDWPFLATNISDFWRRWHMSLTGWITDYVYIPLGGGRTGMRRSVMNTFAAMLLVGAWHGIEVHYLWWGAYHAALLSLYRMWRKKWRQRFKIRDNAVMKVLSIALTFLLVCLGWVLFLMPMSAAVNVYLKLFGLAFHGFSPKLLQ